MASLQAKSESFEEGNNKQILAAWMRAISNFSDQYKAAILVINRQQVKRHGDRSLGQCPLESLLTIVVAMRAELERLTGDINQSELLYPPASRQQYEKLSQHTDILNQLAGKVQVRLQLMASSTS